MLMLSDSRNGHIVAADPNFNPEKYLFINLIWGPTFVKKEGDLQGQFKVAKYAEDHGYRFTIHGLWINPEHPEHTNCLHPERMDREKYEKFQRVDDLKIFWPSFSRFSNKAFWMDEWDRHGTCVTTLFEIDRLKTLEDYFREAFFIAEDVKKRLANLEVLDDGSRGVVTFANKFFQRRHRYDEFVNDLQTLFGVRVHVFCYNYSPFNEFDEWELRSIVSAIDICFDEDLNYHDCPEDHRIDDTTCDFEFIELPRWEDVYELIVHPPVDRRFTNRPKRRQP